MLGRVLLRMFFLVYFQTGILSGLPHLMRMIFAYVFSLFADYLLRTEKMSRTNIRKLATAICKYRLSEIEAFIKD